MKKWLWLILLALAFAVIANVANAEHVPVSLPAWSATYQKIVPMKGRIPTSGNVQQQIRELFLNAGGKKLICDSGVTYTINLDSADQQVWLKGDNIELVGNGSWLKITGSAARTNGLLILGKNVRVTDLRITFDSTTGYSQTHGQTGNAVTLGRYTDNFFAQNVYLENLHVRSDVDGNASMYLLGNTNNVKISNCTFDSVYARSAIGLHWGNRDQVETFSTHPHNIIIEDCKARFMNQASSEFISMSGAYNVEVRNSEAIACIQFADVIIGDFGMQYALDFDNTNAVTYEGHVIAGQTMRGPNILFENCQFTSAAGDAAFKVSGNHDTAQVVGAADSVKYDLPVVFRNCTALGTAVSNSKGFVLDNCRGVVIEDCDVSGMENGVVTGQNVKDLHVIRGTFYDIGAFGIAADYGTASERPVGVNVIGATFRGCATAAIYFGGYGGLVAGCYFGDSADAKTQNYGVYTPADGDAKGLIVTNNFFRAATVSAMYFDEQDDAVEFNNLIWPGVTRFTGTQPQSFTGETGTAYVLPNGGTIQTYGSNINVRSAAGSYIGLNNNGGAAVRNFNGDLVYEQVFTDDSVFFRYNAGTASLPRDSAVSQAFFQDSVTYRYNGAERYTWHKDSAEYRKMLSVNTSDPIDSSRICIGGFCITRALADSMVNALGRFSVSGASVSGPFNYDGNTADPTKMYLPGGDTGIVIDDGTERIDVRPGSNDSLGLFNHVTVNKDSTVAIFGTGRAYWDLYTRYGATPYKVRITVDSALAADTTISLPSGLGSGSNPFGSSIDSTDMVPDMGDGRILIGQNTGVPKWRLMLGTANQVSITNGTNSITVGLAAPHSWTSLTGPLLGNGSSNPTAMSFTLNRILLGNTTSQPGELAAGTSTQVLHGGTPPVWGAVSLTSGADISGILPSTNGGTSSNLSAGASGGIPYFSATGTMSSSAVFSANQVVLGGGAGTAPATLGSLGTTTQVLHGNAAGAPTWGAIDLAADVGSSRLPVANMTGSTGNGTIPIGQTTGSAVWAAITGTANQITNTTGTNSSTLSLAGPHNFTTLTDNGVVIGNTTSAPTVTAAGTNGQILTGQTGSDPSFQTMSGDGTFSSGGALDVTVDSSDIPAAGISKTNIKQRSFPLDVIVWHGVSPRSGLDTTLELSLPFTDAVTTPKTTGLTPYMFSDSTPQTTDTTWVLGSVLIPERCTIDSVVTAYQLSSATGITVDSVWWKVPDISTQGTGIVEPDSLGLAWNVDYTGSTSITRAAALTLSNDVEVSGATGVMNAGDICSIVYLVKRTSANRAFRVLRTMVWVTPSPQ